MTQSLTYEELRDIIDLTLWAGHLLLQHGAVASRVEETVHHIGTGLGCDSIQVLIGPNGITITAISDQEFRTKSRRVVRLGLNYTIIDQVNELSFQIASKKLDRFQLRKELEKITLHPVLYNRWAVMVMVGVTCASASRLFGADFPVVFATFFSSCAAMYVRQELVRHHINHFLMVIAAAFVSSFGVALAYRMGIGTYPELGIAGSVVHIVPGALFITSVEDILNGNILIGMTRGMMALVMSLSIAIGIAFALTLTGVSML
jgi:uncharacterized membrane protein YjjP (DUF1212 family)